MQFVRVTTWISNQKPSFECSFKTCCHFITHFTSTVATKKFCVELWAWQDRKVSNYVMLGTVLLAKCLYVAEYFDSKRIAIRWSVLKITGSTHTFSKKFVQSFFFFYSYMHCLEVMLRFSWINRAKQDKSRFQWCCQSCIAECPVNSYFISFRKSLPSLPLKLYLLKGCWVLHQTSWSWGKMHSLIETH